MPKEGKKDRPKGFERLWAICTTGEEGSTFQGRPVTDYSPNKREMYARVKTFSQVTARGNTRTAKRAGKRKKYIVCRKPA